jgi:hypothetical protein
MPGHALPTNLMVLTTIRCRCRVAEHAAEAARPYVHGTAQIVITSHPFLAGPNLLLALALFGALLLLRSCNSFFRELKDVSHSWEVIQ